MVSSRLTLPHPRAHLRAFVLAPLCELEPELALPDLGPVSTLLAACRDQRCERMAGS
jgi:2-amino-4-hydroxy-6-hydroxymethyldihydropteridine diphosphokinase